MIRALPAKLGYRPELDGLRGVAIAGVLITHLTANAWLGPGIAGVVLFFVLSGFLITTLLVEERERDGHIGLLAFYGRRARRLLPALAAYLLIVTPLAMWLRPQDANADGALSTALYVANWWQAANPEHAGAFGQMWSLGIEEQFYWMWPIVLIGLLAVLPRRRAAIAALALAAASMLLRFALASDERWVPLFFQTPYRLDAILLGCALAMWPIRGSWWIGAGMLAVAVVLPMGTPMLAFGLTAAAVGAGLILMAALRQPGCLRWSPLVALGKVSYSLYLWHAAVFVLLPDLWWPVKVGLSLVVALASYRLVEEPIRRFRFTPARRFLVIPAFRS